jgi:hypothetical protein
MKLFDHVTRFANLYNKVLTQLSQATVQIIKAIVDKMPMATRCEGLLPIFRLNNVKRYDGCVCPRRSQQGGVIIDPQISFKPNNARRLCHVMLISLYG